MITIRMTGMERLQAKLERVQNLGAVLARPIRDGIMLLSTDLRRYPPISEANLPPSPPPGHFYTRGVGYFYLRKNGTPRRVTPSQRLGVSWSARYTNTPTLARGELTTGVTYAPFVHDRDRQARIHAKRGWLTVQALFAKHGPRIVDNMAGAVRQVLAS